MAERFRILIPGAIETRDADGEERFRATITTEEVDRYGDVVVAAGVDVAAYRKNPVVLFAHRGDQPIGRATRVWREGNAWLAEFTLASTEKAREVAELIRQKVLSAVSIGFTPKDRPTVRRDDEGNWLGMVFGSTELLEFSVVSVPANASALIARALADPEAAPGREPMPRGRGRHSGNTTMPIGSDIARLRKAHGEAIASAQILYDLASEEGRPLGEDERKTYDGHLAEADGLAGQLADAEKLEKALQRSATPIDSGRPGAPALIKPPSPREKLAKGVSFARYAMAIAAARGNGFEAAEIAKRWRDSTPEVEAVIRAAVAAGTTSTPAWAGALVPTAQFMGGELIELLFPASILGQLNLRPVPFNVAIPRVTGGATANWVGEGKLKPVSKAAFDKVTLAFNKLAVISVLTEELVRFSDPSAEVTVRDLLVEAIRLKMDQTFISAGAAVSGVSPAGILNGVTPIVAAGTDAETIQQDILQVLAVYIAAGIPIASITMVMNPLLAVSLSMLRFIDGTMANPALGVNGGTMMGMRVVSSETVGVTAGTPPDLGTSSIIFISERNVLLARDPAMRIDSSREATIEMSDDPETDTGTMVNLWQANMLGILVEQFITWEKARAASVQVLTGVPITPTAA